MNLQERDNRYRNIVLSCSRAALVDFFIVVFLKRTISLDFSEFQKRFQKISVSWMYSDQ